MRRMIGVLAYLGYVLAGVGAAMMGPRVGFGDFASVMLGLSLATASIGAHLIILSARRAARLTALLTCQDDLLRQIVERLNRAETRTDGVESKLGTLGDVKGTLQDVAAMLAVRAAGRPVLRAA